PPRLGVLDDVRQLRHAGLGRNEDVVQADSLRAERQSEQRWSVLDAHNQAVAASRAERAKRVRGPVGVLLECAKVQPTAAGHEDGRQLARLCVRDMAQMQGVSPFKNYRLPNRR